MFISWVTIGQIKKYIIKLYSIVMGTRKINRKSKKSKKSKKSNKIKQTRSKRGGGGDENENENEPNVCAICLEPINMNIPADNITTQCSHTFHRNCLSDHCRTRATMRLDAKCPLCRALISDTCLELGVVGVQAPVAVSEPDIEEPDNIERRNEIVGRIRNGNLTNLQGADLRGANLRGANLRGAHLERAHLERADLRDAHLEGAHLEGAHLEGANSRGAHLEGANLRGAHLEGARLDGADLRQAHLEGAHLRGAELTGTNFEEAHLDGADFTNIDDINDASFGNNTGTPIGLPDNIILIGGKRKTRKTKNKTRKTHVSTKLLY